MAVSASRLSVVKIFSLRSLREIPCSYFPLTSFVSDVTVFLIFEYTFGAVAQLGEHKAGSLGVRGSIPLSSTKNFKRLIARLAFFISPEGERT